MEGDNMPREKTMEHCEECNEAVERLQVVELPDGTVELCDDCYNTEVVRCNGCGELVMKRDAEDQNGDAFCTVCYNNLPVCDNCNERYTSDTVECEGDNLCEECAEDATVECEECGTIIYSSHSYRHNGDAYCRSCHNDNFSVCDNCGDEYHNDEMNSHNNDALCNSCYEDAMEEDDGGEAIHDYSYKPVPIFYRHGITPRTEPFLGIELEAEAERNTALAPVAEAVLATLNKGEEKIYNKHDGSLSHGFEVVSHPMTLSYHNNKADWPALCAKMVSLKMRSHDTTTCGLHVHVSKQGMSQTQMVRLGVFVHTQRVNMEKLARRSASHYSQFKKVKDDNGNILHGECNRSRDRYEALNWQPRNTVEFRLFRGTLNADTLLASIQLAHACVMFVKSRKVTTELVSDESWAWSHFCAFVSNKRNHKRYEKLIAYMKAKRVWHEAEAVAVAS